MGSTSPTLSSLVEGGDYDYLFKILLIGDSGVGKSCLLNRYSDCAFDENQTSTIGVDFKIRTMDVDNKSVKLQIWDAAGQERFRAVSKSYYRGAHGVGIVFDLTRLESFESVEGAWIQEIFDNDCSDIPQLLIGNKCDLRDGRRISRFEAAQFAEEHGMTYIEASAKTCENVNEAFESITRKMCEERGEQKMIEVDEEDDLEDYIQVSRDDDIFLTSATSKPKSRCC